MSEQTGADWKEFNFLLPEDLNGEIEGELEYGDSKAEWIRQACRIRLESDQNTQK